MKIRKANRSDITQLQNISKDVINQNYREFLGDAAVDFFIDSGANDEYIEKNIEHTTIAIINHQIVGICVCLDNLIDLMMIHNDYQHLGIGSLFIQEMTKVLFKTYQILRVECFAKNKKANQYYQKNGWIEVKRIYDEELNDERVYYVMEK